MKKIFLWNVLLLVLLTLPLVLCSCNTTEPPIDNIEPGRRDYEWSVDTISAGPDLFYLFSIWGSSPANLWAIGHADESLNSLWHYNGTTWKRTSQQLGSNIQSIWGFDSTNVWICDSPGGNIFHFDGISWQNAGYYPYPGYNLSLLNNIWGAKPDEIYIAGAASDQEKGSLATLLYYDGSQWKYVSIPEKKMFFVWIRQSKEKNYLYITAIESTQSGDIYNIFIYDGDKLDEICSSQEGAYAYEMNGKIYICIGQKIYKHQNNQLVLWKDFSQTNFLGMLCGRNEKDFFGVASDGLTHYNGTDLKTIYPTNLFINNIFVMEKDVYMICEYRIIIHGKLKDG